MKLLWRSALCCFLTVRLCLLESLIVEVAPVFSQEVQEEPAQQGLSVGVSYLTLRSFINKSNNGNITVLGHELAT